MRIVLEPCGIRPEGNWTGVYWQINTGDMGIQIEHSVPNALSTLLPEPDIADHILLTTLLYAMQQGASLDIRGSISSKVLDGCEHLQEVWSRWRPDRYKQIDIQFEREEQRQSVSCEAGLAKTGGLFAFSGGVDATFTLMRHYYGVAGRQTVKPKAALMVQGFDIPYSSDSDYERAVQRSTRILEECPGVKLIKLRTNSRGIDQCWKDSFGLQLGACFLLLQNHFTHALLGSDSTYDDLVFPWGSSPLTTRLYSTERMNIVDDGSGFDRNEKVEYLAERTNSTVHLRVCWAGSQMDRNCGKCEKCVRTMLNFWANNLTIPGSFPSKLSRELVESVSVRNEIQASYFRSIQRLALKNNIHGTTIARAVARVLFRYRYKSIIDAPNSIASWIKGRCKHFVKSMIQCS